MANAWVGTGGQVTGFVIARLLASASGALVTTLLARVLPTSRFGSYALASAVLPLLAMFFEFGIFLPAGRMAARSDARTGRVVFGATLLAYAPIGVAFTVTVFVTSFLVAGSFDAEAGRALRLVAPVALVYPFQFVAEQLTQGLGRLHVYSATTVLGRILFVTSVLVALAWGADLSVAGALLLEAVTVLVGWAVLVRWLRPIFAGATGRVRALAHEARLYGLHVYVGRVLSMGTYNMDVLMLGWLAGSRWVGFYTLAGAIASPIALPAIGIAAALFPRLTAADRLDRRALLFAALLGALAALMTVALCRPFIGIVLSPRYLPAAPLVLPLALAQAVRGPTALFNSFLSAHGRGRDLRNTGLVLTGSNVVLNFLLIPPYGAAGAAWASLLALVANLAVHVASYRRTCRLEAAAP